jgi:transketolase
MRQVFGDRIVAERARRPELIVLDGDNATSTKTDGFAKRYPESFVNVGIAEQNLVGIAAGLALTGHVPIACAFASMLVGRAADQIMQSVAYQGLPVKLAGHYAGMSGSREGAPHHSIADLAYLRAVPGLSIWIPAEDADVEGVLETVLDEPGPSYLRLCREPTGPLPAPDGSTDDGCRTWGEADGDVLLVATGVMVGEALRATALLEDSGIRAGVLGVVRLKPFPAGSVEEAAAGSRLIVTVEEHSVVGGLGGAVAELLSRRGSGPLVRIGLDDTFTETGAYPDLLRKYGLTAESIADRARVALEEVVAA